MSDGRLEGKVAVVTGGASGIGLAIVERFHAEGARVVVADISGDEAAVAERLGARAAAIHVDVTCSADVRAMLRFAVERFGALDVLCNNAGIDGGLTLLADIEEAQYERILAVNLRSVFLGLKYAIPIMKQRGGGCIVNTSSLAGIISVPGFSVYGATKAAINQLTRSAAAEYAMDGIRVNAVCPASVATPLVMRIMDSVPEAAAALVAKTPMQRVAQPAEIADMVLFFASGECAFITGQCMPIDGGLSIT